MIAFRGNSTWFYIMGIFNNLKDGFVDEVGQLWLRGVQVINSRQIIKTFVIKVGGNIAEASERIIVRYESLNLIFEVQSNLRDLSSVSFKATEKIAKSIQSELSELGECKLYYGKETEVKVVSRQCLDEVSPPEG